MPTFPASRAGVLIHAQTVVRSTLGVFAVGVALSAARPLQAQVGHRPGNSPYEDVKIGQTVSLSGGWFAFKRDLAGEQRRFIPTHVGNTPS